MKPVTHTHRFGPRFLSIIGQVAFVAMASFLFVGCGMFEQKRSCTSVADCLADERCQESVCVMPTRCQDVGDCMAGESCTGGVCAMTAKGTGGSTPSSPSQPGAAPVKPPTEPGAPSAPPAEPTPPKPTEPATLPEDEFVYVLKVERKVGDSVKDFYFVNAHNIKTDTSRSLFLLGDNAAVKFLSGYVSLSPDRRWIAFLASPIHSDERLKSVWVTSVDGKVTRRISTPTEPSMEGNSVNYESIRYPKWSHDGKFIWINYLSNWSDEYGNSSNYSHRALVNVATGHIRFLNEDPPCYQYTTMAIHRVRAVYALAESDCWLQKSQIVTSENNELKAKVIPHSTINNSGTHSSMAFLGDLLVFHGYYGETDPMPKKRLLFAMNYKTGVTKPLFELKERMAVWSIAASPDQTKLVVKLRSPAETVFEVLYFSGEKILYKTLTLPQDAQSFTW